MTRIQLRNLISLVHLLTIAAATCYYPNGQSDPNPLNGQCLSTKGYHSPCCATNRTNPSGGLLEDGLTSDLCLENGLCKNIATVTAKNGTETIVTEYWRGLCTSSEWPESSCLNICNTGQGSETTMQLTSCDGTDHSTEWCCGTSSYCCGTSDAITINPVLAVLASSRVTASASNPSRTLSTGTKAGIGVGVAAGTILFMGILVCWWLRRRKSRSTAADQQAPTLLARTPTAVAKNDLMIPHSMDAEKQQRVSEMGGGNMYELNGAGGDGLRHELPVARWV